jgi:hypothetical protein
MYAHLPLTVPTRVLVERLVALAMPKSMILVSPLYETITLCGDTSRWMMLSGEPSTSRLCA